MQISKIQIKNFRGIKETVLFPTKNVVFIGDNNTGKTTILEAIDLVLGPDRLNRSPVVDEHDFYAGKYIAQEENEESPLISIEIIITGLTDEQKRRFNGEIEFWDKEKKQLVDCIEDVDAIGEPCLRVSFNGYYNKEDDDFAGETFFTKSNEIGNKKMFYKKDKQFCGFLYLRSNRTGSRALSLERGSLMDIILRIKEIRPQMWESVIKDLSNTSVATQPELGVSEVINSIVTAMSKYVPKDWGISPSLKVSNLTRDNLRKIITAFIPTGADDEHIAPFYRQGSGTINMLVLAMLSQIAEDKQNVIFAMEEPEIAIPPYTQKRIIHEIKQLSSQAFFTSHSPYIIEEFEINDTFVLHRNQRGVLKHTPIILPTSLKKKQYVQQFRTKFCEALLAKRVIIAEGNTEAIALPTVARWLSILNSSKYCPIEALGFAIVDAGGETNIEGLSEMFSILNKEVYALCDFQPEDRKKAIEAKVKKLFMHNQHGIEKLITEETDENAIILFLLNNQINLEGDVRTTLFNWFKDKKGEGRVAEFLLSCNEDQILQFFKDICDELKPREPSPITSTNNMQK